MRLARTRLLVETAHRHLDSVPETTPERSLVANYLAQIASVTFCSEIEGHLLSILKKRMAVNGDEKLAAFIAANQKSTLKRVSKTDLGRTVGMFGDGLRDAWSGDFTEAETTAYSNVVGARHDTAHSDDEDVPASERVGKSSNVTLQEVEHAIEIADRMLGKLEEVIS